MFSKSFWAMKQDLVHGHSVGFSLFGGQGVDKGDKQAILDYNNALNSGVKESKAWAMHMSKASISAQNITRDTLRAKGSLVDLANGLQATSAGAKAASVGLKALSIAGNMLLTMGITMAISAIVSGIQKIASAQEDAIAKADEFIAKFNEQKTSLTENKKAIDSMSEDYEELAKGVDSLGRNVSLNSNEYARYNEIVNQIADMFPQMVQGYTDEGNAIIAHKGNVEELTKAYEEQKKAAQDAIIVGSADVFKGFKAKVDYNAENFIWEESGLSQMKEMAQKLIATQGDKSAIKDVLKEYQNTYTARDLLKKSGLDPGFLYWNVTSEDYFAEHMDAIESGFNIINSEINAQATQVKPIMQAYLERSYDDQTLDEDVQDIVTQIVSAFDSEFYRQFDNETEMAAWVETNVIDKLRENEDLAKDFGVVFDLQTQFNNNKITLAEYEDKLTEFLSAISILPDETQKAIKLIFGIDEDGYDGNQTNKNKILGMLKGDWGEAKEYVGSLTLDELEVGAKLEFDADSVSVDDFKKALEETQKTTDKMTVSLSELEKVSDNIKPLGTAFKELSDDGYITIKTLKEMKDAADLSSEEWANYETKLLKAKVGSSEFNQVMGELTYKILDNAFAGKELNSLTEQQIAAVLREHGVVNASAIAYDYLSRKKNEAKVATLAAKVSEEDFKDSLESVKNETGLTANAIADMILKMIKLNNTKLSLYQQIEQIRALRVAMGLVEDIDGSTLGIKKKQGTVGTGYSYNGKWYNNWDNAYYDALADKTDTEFGNETPPPIIPIYTVDDNGSGKNEVLDNYLKDAENRYKIHQDENKYIQELEYAYNNLTKDEKERLDIIGKINEAYRDLADNRIKDIEHQIDLAKELNEYADVTDYYKQIQKVAHEEANRLRAMGYDDNSNEIQKLQKEWWDAQNSIVDWRWDNSNNWIDERNTYNDWSLFDDSEVAAWERVIKWLNEEYPNDIEKIKEAEQNLFEARKKEFDKGTGYGNTYLDSRKTLLQSYYDVTNSIAEAQHEINKELETSKTMYEYLDKETQQLLFNQEDYNELSDELYDIQYKADKLKRQYERDLSNSTLETIESITSNYQMQYETLMKSYEIAKADLEIAKKKQKLNNVLNERNVRMFINGSWQWVANTEDVANAKSELADAEYAKRVEEAGLTQQQSINNLTKQQDELGVVIKSFENGVIDLEEAIRQAEEAIGSMPNALASIFNNAKVRTPSSYSSGGSGGGSGGGFSGGNSGGGQNTSYINWAKSQMAENSKNWHNADENGKKALEAANQALGKAIDSTYDPTTGKWKHKYATGSKYTKDGLSLLGEEGFEAYITSNGRLIPINQPMVGDIPSGGVVFNTEQMKNLRTMWDMSNLKFKGGTFVGDVQPQQIDQRQDNRIIINGMTVDSGSADGQALISALRRYVGNH